MQEFLAPGHCYIEKSAFVLEGAFVTSLPFHCRSGDHMLGIPAALFL